MKIDERLRPVVQEMVREATSPFGYDEAVNTFRRVYLLEQLRECGWNQCRAAIVLGIHRNTLARQMVECGITDEVLDAGRAASYRRRGAAPDHDILKEFEVRA